LLAAPWGVNRQTRDAIAAVDVGGGGYASHPVGSIGAGRPPKGHFARRPKIRRSRVMLRVRWKTALAIAFAAATTSMAAGSPAGHLRASMERAISEAGGLVLRTHGSHLKCRYGKHGKSKEEWHRHDRGATYPCAPPSKDVQRFEPSTAGKGSISGPSGQKTGTSPVFGPPASAGPKTGTSPVFGPPASSGQKTVPTTGGAKRR
jgi:hypothetical protein